MTFPFACNRRSILIIFCLFGITGCSPPPGSGTTTPVERYLKTGQARAEQNDFDGALAAYEKALSININNASVHYQLALLFDADLNQPEKSLYHFTRVLELNPDYRWSDMIKDRIPGLRMRVSSGTIPMLSSAELEQEIVKLHRDLARKSEELQRLASQNQLLQQRVRTIANTTAQQPAQQSRQPAAQQPTATAPQRSATQQPSQPAPRASTATTPTPRTDTTLRYTPPRQINYTVLRGDTLYSLGRRYGISHTDILKANPGLVANDIKVGQTIVIPGQ